MMPPSRGRGLAIAAILLGIAFGLVAGELALRLADRAGVIDDFEEARTARTSSIWMRSANRELIYQHRPNYVKGALRMTERHGILRPVDASRPRAAGVTRVLALGDSVAAAIKLPYDERVFTQVERLLATAIAAPTEVLNFGVNGYSTAQEAALLQELAGGFEADALVLQYCVNDFYPTETPTRWFLDEPPLYLLTFARNHLDRSRLRGYQSASYWEELYRDDEEGWRSVEAGFRAVTRYTSSRHIPAMLVIFPNLSHGGWMEGNAAQRHRQVTELGARTGFTVLDLLPDYAKHPVEKFRFEPWDTFHPNPQGHRLAAEVIAKRLRNLLRH